MKMILAVVWKDDEEGVTEMLNEGGFYVTKLATKGGFLKKTNSTLLIGTEDEKVDAALAIIRKYAGKREITVHEPLSEMVHVPGSAPAVSVPVKQTIGGCTVFVLDMDKFEKM